MTKLEDLVSIDHMKNIEQAISLLARHNISSLVVVKEGLIVGIVTNKDIIKVLDDENINAFGLPIGSIMQRDLHSVKATAPLNHAIEKMNEIQTHHLLITSKSRYVGLLSSFDIVREKALDSKSHPWIRS